MKKYDPTVHLFLTKSQAFMINKKSHSLKGLRTLLITEQKAYPPRCHQVKRYKQVFTSLITQEPGVRGDCADDQSRWTNVNRFGCYVFQYSGCGGNGNNFQTENECLQSCKSIINVGQLLCKPLS